jgi:hypothetical protein
VPLFVLSPGCMAPGAFCMGAYWVAGGGIIGAAPAWRRCSSMRVSSVAPLLPEVGPNTAAPPLPAFADPDLRMGLCARGAAGLGAAAWAILTNVVPPACEPEAMDACAKAGTAIAITAATPTPFKKRFMPVSSVDSFDRTICNTRSP